MYEFTVFSDSRLLPGKCDCVEAHKDSSGCRIPVVEFPVQLYPIEYKHGTLREEEEYRIQLCAQAMCLEEMFHTVIPESYIFCRNENICVRIEDAEKLCVPALNIDSIVCFGKMTVSTPLLEFCGNYGISLIFLRENGHFMGRLQGSVSGNVLLRKRQYASMQDTAFAQQTVQSIFAGKTAKQQARSDARSPFGTCKCIPDGTGVRRRTTECSCGEFTAMQQH